MSSSSDADCVNCPSFLKEEQTPGYFKKSPGAPMCMRFGHVLGRHGLKPSAQAKITVAFANGCESFGEAAPLSGAPVRPEARVAVGDRAVLLSGDSAADDQEKVNTCLQCANYVKPEAVKREMGWTFGLCAASGRLLWPTRLTVEARNCTKRTPGASRTTTTGVELLPAFEEAFDYSRSPIEAFLAGKPKSIIDPREYPTDKPVEPEWAESGVRAWRRIEDPKGTGNFTHLPIYRGDFFPEEERRKIPQMGDDERPESFVDYAGVVYKAAVLWQELDETPMLWGMPGVGKTEAFRHLAHLMQIPFERFSVTASTEVDDLAGKFVAEEGPSGATVTRFVYGPLPTRWTRPGLFLVDEYNAASNDVAQLLRPCVDNSKQFVLVQNEGEELPRDNNCYLGLTGNPAWDAMNTGVNTLAAADADRLMHIEVGLPPEALEREILRRRCEEDDYAIPAEMLDKIMRIANGDGGDNPGGIRDLRDTLNISWGLRPQIKVARASRWFDLLDCYLLAAGDNLEPETRAALLDVVKQYHVT